MLALAQKLASYLKTEVISSRMDGDRIVFVLASGPKQSMTEAELNQAISKFEEPEPAKTKIKKGK